MSVRISASRQVTLLKHVVTVNVRYGAENEEDGKWSLTISNRTGIGTPEQEVLETFAWRHFEGFATPAQFRKIKQWLEEYNLHEDDYGFVAVAVKQLNDGMKDSFARWKKE